MMAQKLVNESVFAFWLNRFALFHASVYANFVESKKFSDSNNSDSAGGEITFGGTDPDRYVGPINFVAVTRPWHTDLIYRFMNMIIPIHRGWQFPIKCVQWNTGGKFGCKGTCQAIADTG